MNFPFYIAKRYLISKKKRNVINIISGISITGVTAGTIALIVILSIFNGFDVLINSLFNSFNPDIKITSTQGKFFNPDSITNYLEKNHKNEINYSLTVEENALIKYGNKQYIATIKGVDDNFSKVTGVDTMIAEGKFMLKDKNDYYAVVGYGVKYYLSIGLKFITPLKIYIPRKDASLSSSALNAFNSKYLFPSGIFSIQQDFDSKYVLVDIKFAQELFETNKVSAVEIKTKDNNQSEKLFNELSVKFGSNFTIQDRARQHEFLFKIMQSERMAIILILSFILFIASFNILGSLTMLIIDKKEDIEILSSMGANKKTIKTIFLYEGWLISITGAVIGLVIGGGLCYLQQKFGIIKLAGSGSFVIDYYPVDLRVKDFLLSFVIVVGIGYVAAWYPVKLLTRKL